MVPEMIVMMTMIFKRLVWGVMGWLVFISVVADGMMELKVKDVMGVGTNKWSHGTLEFHD